MAVENFEMNMLCSKCVDFEYLEKTFGLISYPKAAPLTRNCSFTCKNVSLVRCIVTAANQMYINSISVVNSVV